MSLHVLAKAEYELLGGHVSLAGLLDYLVPSVRFMVYMHALHKSCLIACGLTWLYPTALIG